MSKVTRVSLQVAGITIQVESPDLVAALPSYSFTLREEPEEPAAPSLDGIVVDEAAGLMWSQANVLPKKCTHAEAEEACKALRLGGFDDWRLPNVKELVGLVDYGRYDPAIDPEKYPTCNSDWYWTSSIYASSPGCAWVVNFLSGNADYAHRDYYDAFVRAVRSVAPGQ